MKYEIMNTKVEVNTAIINDHNHNNSNNDN